MPAAWTGRPQTRPVVIAALTTVALLIPIGWALLAGSGTPEQRLNLSGGGAWLASPGKGFVTLIDGPSDQVVATVTVPSAGPGLSVTQDGASAFVADNSSGTISRIDGATYQTSASVKFGAPRSDLSVLAGGGSAFVIDATSRIATIVDPTNLSTLRTFTLPARPGPQQSLVGAAGRLWTVDAGGAGLSWSDPSGGHGRASADRTAQLVTVDGRPALVDVGAPQPQISWLNNDGSTGPWACHLPSRAGDTVALLGSQTGNEVFAALSQTGTLVIADESDRVCGAVVKVGDAGAVFGGLVQSGRFVFVPDQTTGATVVVDTRADTVVTTVPLTGRGHHLQLLTKDGLVFYNDLDSEKAGVLLQNSDGSWVAGNAIQKYNPDTGMPSNLIVSASKSLPSISITEPHSSAPPASSVSPPPSTPPPLSSRATVSSRTSNPSGPVRDSAGGNLSALSPPSSSPPPHQPDLQAPTIGAISISSPFGKPYQSGDVLSFSAVSGGGAVSSWSWSAVYADSGVEQAHSATSTLRTAVNSGGSSSQDYKVTVIVKNAAGQASTSTSFSVGYNWDPFVGALNISPNPVSPGAMVSINPVIRPTTFTSCTWTLNGSSALCTGPIAAPTTAGDYQAVVTLTARGKTSSGHDTLTVNEPTVTCPSTGNANEPMTCTATATGTNLTWYWTTSDGQTGSSAGTFTFTPSTMGDYTVSVQVTSPGGIASHGQSGIIHILDNTPPTGVVTPSDPTVGDARPVTVTVTDHESGIASGGVSVWYDVGCNGTFTSHLEQGVFPGAGDSTETITIYNGLACPGPLGVPQPASPVFITSVTATATDGAGLSWNYP